MTVTDIKPLAQIAAEALRGPWHAVLADSYGYTMTLDDFDGNGTDPADVCIAIVRGSAAPDEHGRLPGTYQADDYLVEFDDFEEPEEVEARFVQAQAMVAGLNRASEVPR